MQSTVLKIHVEDTDVITGVTDEELMLRYAQEDTGAFEELFHRHKNSVMAFIRGFASMEEIREDLFQNVFIRVIKSRKMYKPVAKFSTWLFSITRSVCIDAMRKKKRDNVIPLYSSQNRMTEDMDSFEPVSESPTPRETQYHAELQETLWEIIGSLPDSQREVLLLREKTCLTFEEIAKVIDCPVNTVKARMHYALLQLRAELRERGFDSL